MKINLARIHINWHTNHLAVLNFEIKINFANFTKVSKYINPFEIINTFMMKRKIKLWMGSLLTNCNRLIAKYIRLKNHGFSIIANNCCGGMIYHDLGEQFHSPTINLFMLPLDFFIFLENFDEARCTPVNEIEHDRLGEKPDYPLGEIRLRNGENIQIHFRHYTTFDSAKEKWENRCKRINKDNLFILMELGSFTSEKYVKRFDSLPFENKAVITSKPFNNIKSVIHIDIYGQGYKLGMIVDRLPGTIIRYLDLFDYIHWLNTGKIRHVRFYKSLLQKGKSKT